ncbi:MAG TPA: hypothetical protein ACFYEK_17855 [Candidatus Wunengus sp. YC60]|uniref:hypothetical protein n=1 Tax=Candidatus Wunengus sp. YC60 TaxID=3367697 RepID=UPI0040297083
MDNPWVIGIGVTVIGGLILYYVFGVGNEKHKNKIRELLWPHFFHNSKVFGIISATYGSGNTFIDITTQVNELVIDNKLKIVLSNGIPGYDPTPGKVKIGKIKFELNKKIIIKTYREGEAINLP